MATARRTLTSAVCCDADTAVAQGLELSWGREEWVRAPRVASLQSVCGVLVPEFREGQG